VEKGQSHPERSTMSDTNGHDHYPLAGVILAGGKNTRMGVNKAFIKVGEQRIIDRTADLFKALFRQVILVTNTPLEYASLDLEIAVDLIHENSPLVGIYTGLCYSSHPYCFVAGCDMPSISREILTHMISRCPRQDVIIPLLDDGYHPLHAIYSKRCITTIEELIRSRKFKITDLFPYIRLREVTADELRPLDRTFSSVLNLNTPEDLKRLGKMP